MISLAFASMGVMACSASLQQAVDESVDGCIVIMRAGTWNEDVRIDNDLTIIGGYGGGETVISGDTTGSVFTIDYADVVLTGLTITNGNAAFGGGINNDHGTLILNGVSITGCNAHSGGGIYNLGGTVTMNGASSISGNTATYHGGGIFNSGGTVNQYGGIVSGNIPDQIYNV